MATRTILCYCQGHCPDGSHNGTCIARPGAYCYAFVQEVLDEQNGKLEEEWGYGCLPPEEEGYMQCQGKLSPHAIPRMIECCHDENYCNMKLRPIYEASEEDPLPETSVVSDLMMRNKFILWMIPIFVFILLAILIWILVAQLKKRREWVEKGKSRSTSTESSMLDGYFDHDNSKYRMEDDDDREGESTCYKSGLMDSSGGTVPLLVQRTIARDIDWSQVKWSGRGRYGQVLVAPFRGTRVAIKVFNTTEESSWLREQAIYNTPLLRHENILGFISTDIRGTGGVTQMLLITDYHEYGSLYDFISCRTLVEETLIKMMCSIASGVCHLHTEISGRQNKPAIAHRDIKSKNILVKSDLSCCLADFGLSVTYESSTKQLSKSVDNVKVGTKRYMAPEILDDTMDINDFEAYKRADLYSMSLVIWEMLRRTIIAPDLPEVEEYEVPFQALVPNDPSFEDMKTIVCDRKIRPEINRKWYEIPSLKPVVKLIMEGFSDKAKVRPSARKFKNDLNDVLRSFADRKEKVDMSNNFPDVIGVTDFPYAGKKPTTSSSSALSFTTTSSNYSPSAKTTSTCGKKRYIRSPSSGMSSTSSSSFIIKTAHPTTITTIPSVEDDNEIRDPSMTIISTNPCNKKTPQPPIIGPPDLLSSPAANNYAIA